MNRENQRKMEEKAILESVTPIARPISDALMKFMHVASHLNSDCYVLSDFGRRLLEERGISTEMHIGWAAWRFGRQPQAWVAYAPLGNEYIVDGPAGAPGAPYHTWLNYRGCIIDFTTYDLRNKAAILDKRDGLRTTVTWCPNFLILPRTQIRSLSEVRRGSVPATSYYERRPELDSLIHAGHVLDVEDLTIVRWMLANPHAGIAGRHGFFDPRGSRD